MPTHREFERALYLRKLVFASDEPRQSAPRCHVKMTPQQSCAHHLVNVDWLGDTPERCCPQMAQLEIILDQLARVVAHDYPASRRYGLQPRRQVRRMTHGRIFRMRTRVDCAQHHLARIDPDAR